MSKKNKEKRQKSSGLALYAMTVLTLGIAIIAVTMILLFHVQTIVVSGNTYIESDVIAKCVQGKQYTNNSLVIMMKNAMGKFKYPKSVESVKVRMTAPWGIKLMVQEKKPIGCAVIENDYVLFDEDGLVLGKQVVQPEGVLLVEDIQAEGVKLYEKLPVKETRIFRNIIEASETFDEYSIKPSRVLCKGADLTVYLGEICVELGSGDMEMKIDQLPGILEKIKGKKGTLDLKHYSDSTEIVSFKEGEYPKTEEELAKEAAEKEKQEAEQLEEGTPDGEGELENEPSDVENTGTESAQDVKKEEETAETQKN